MLIGRWNAAARRKVYKPQITVDGRRAIAQRTGVVFAVEGPVWCGPRINGELVWQDVWDDEEQSPYCARVFDLRPARRAAAEGERDGEVVRVRAVHRRRPRSARAASGRLMPSHMLGKVAEAMALRRAFPESVELPPVALTPNRPAHRAWLAYDKPSRRRSPPTAACTTRTGPAEATYVIHRPAERQQPSAHAARKPKAAAGVQRFSGVGY